MIETGAQDGAERPRETRGDAEAGPTAGESAGEMTEKAAGPAAGAAERTGEELGSAEGWAEKGTDDGSGASPEKSMPVSGGGDRVAGEGKSPAREAGQTTHRGLIMAWCVWLLGSWAVALLKVSAAPAARLMVMSAAVGLLLIWPALSLSQSGRGTRDAERGGRGAGEARRERVAMPGRREALRALGEWLFLVMVLQAVLWPLKLSAPWELRQVLMLESAMLSWSLLAALLVALGRGAGGSLARSLAMAACVLLLLGEPIVMVVINAVMPGVHVAWQMRVSPLSMIWDLAGKQVPWHGDVYQTQVVTAAVAAIGGWLVLLLTPTPGSAPGSVPGSPAGSIPGSAPESAPGSIAASAPSPASGVSPIETPSPETRGEQGDE